MLIKSKFQTYKEYNKIDLKVELIEQKLRKYFGYWLDACCSFIEFIKIY